MYCLTFVLNTKLRMQIEVKRGVSVKYQKVATVLNDIYDISMTMRLRRYLHTENAFNLMCLLRCIIAIEYYVNNYSSGTHC